MQPARPATFHAARPSPAAARARSAELDAAILARVEKPSRYLGGELGQTRKDLSSVDTAVGLCYPDLYEIGMSHIGLKILYKHLNDDPRCAAERVYSVAQDMEGEMRARGLVLRTLENRVPLKDLQILGFTLQYELSYSNLLQVLDLGGIPLFSKDRDASQPLVVAGGPCAFNPEPLAPFLDAVCLGDGEETIRRIVEVHRAWRRRGPSAARQDLLWMLTEVPGVYVPSLYTVQYHDDGRVAAIEPSPGLPARIRKAILPDLDSAPYHTATPVPFMQVVHDRVGVEIQRGCMRGCRFCQAGYIYRPERQRSPETIRRLVREGLRATGQEEYSLLSLSAGDYNCMEPLLTALMDEHEASRSAISLPSMRLETLSPGIMDQVDRVRKTSFTVAPEAASDRLRAVINKVIDEDVLEGMVGEVFRRGWKSLKFYFMLGIPTEQYEDLQAMVDLGSRCLSAAKRHNRAAGITISVSSFVPKSHTPFQWATQITLPEIEEKQDFLRRELKRAGLGFRWHDARSSVMEGIYSRGDRRSADALLAAYKHGARLDGWQEHFSEEAWQTAFAETGLEPGFYNQRRRDSDEVFPWAHIDCGIEPRWLWEDWMDSLEAGFVPDCTTEPCYDCGVCDHATVHNRVFDRATPGAEPLHRVRKPYQGSRKAEDPQFVAMPRPPGRKGNHVVDAAPPQGMAPGSAPARASRAAHAERVRAAGVTPGKARERVVPHGHEAVRVPGAPRTGAGPGTDWSQVFDTRLPVELRVVVELRYGKLGALAFLGHLEVMAAFRRALKRVSAPVLWTQGFHPQPRFSFGPPLPTGMASVAEHAEIELKRPLDLSVFAEELRRAMPEELPLLDVREVPHGRPSIQDRIEAWVYELRPPAGTGSLELAREAAARFLAAPVCMVSSVRKGEARDVDVRPAVRGLQEQDGAFRVEVAAAGAGARIRDVIEGIFGEAAAQGHGGWQSTRVETLFQAGRGATTA